MDCTLTIERKPGEKHITIHSHMGALASGILIVFMLAAAMVMVLSVGAILMGSGKIFEFLMALLSPAALLVMLRLWLWNHFGEERIVIRDNDWEQNFFYRYWTDRNAYSESIESVEFETTDTGKKKTLGRLVLKSKTKTYRSVLRIRETDFETIEPEGTGLR